MAYKINNIWSFNISFDLNENGPLEPVSFQNRLSYKNQIIKHWFIFKTRPSFSDIFNTFYNWNISMHM